MITLDLKSLLGLATRGTRLDSSDYLLVQRSTSGRPEKVPATLAVPIDSVDTDSLVDDSVTQDKIDYQAVGNDQLSPLAVDRSKLQTGIIYGDVVPTNALGNCFSNTAGDAGWTMSASLADLITDSITITSAMVPANVVLIGTATMQSENSGGDSFCRAQLAVGASNTPLGQLQYSHYQYGAVPPYSGGSVTCVCILEDVGAQTLTVKLRGSYGGIRGRLLAADIVAIVLGRQ